VVIIAFESAQKQRTFRTRECETKEKKRATFDSSLFRHTSSSTTERLRMCSSSQTPVKTNKKKERRVSVQVLDILFIIAFTKQKKKKHSKDFLSFFLSLSLSLSLSVGKKYTLQEGTASDSFCAVYITAFSKKYKLQRCVIIDSIASFHQEGERERERSEIYLARTRARAAQARWERYKTKNLFSCLFLFVSKTDSYEGKTVIRCNQSRRTAHKRESCNNHRQSQSTPPLLSFY